jgi:hypothetical protein
MALCQSADESMEELFQFQHILQRIGEPITRVHFTLSGYLEHSAGV